MEEKDLFINKYYFNLKNWNKGEAYWNFFLKAQWV